MTSPATTGNLERFRRRQQERALQYSPKAQVSSGSVLIERVSSSYYALVEKCAWPSVGPLVSWGLFCSYL